MNPANVTKLLRDKFGLGDEPAWTAKLYERLQREAMAFDAPVLLIIQETIAAAEFAHTSPGHFFRKVCPLRLKAAGFLRPEPEKAAANRRAIVSIAGDLAAKVAPPPAERPRAGYVPVSSSEEGF
jgi:hypothetical protein